MRRWAGNPWRRFGLSAGISWFVVGGYGLAAALILVCSIGGWQAVYARRPVDHVVTVLCVLFAAASAGYAARCAAGRHRFGWLALATGLRGLGGG